MADHVTARLQRRGTCRASCARRSACEVARLPMSSWHARCTSVGSMSGRDENADPRPSATGLIDSAVQLIRAEVALTFLRARHGATRAVVALVATLVTAELALFTLLLMLSTPMLVDVVPWRSVSLSFGGSLAVTLASAFFAWRAWRRALAATRPREHAGTPSAPPEVASAPNAALLTAPAIQKN